MCQSVLPIMWALEIEAWVRFSLYLWAMSLAITQLLLCNVMKTFCKELLYGKALIVYTAQCSSLFLELMASPRAGFSFYPIYF